MYDNNVYSISKRTLHTSKSMIVLLSAPIHIWFLSFHQQFSTKLFFSSIYSFFCFYRNVQQSVKIFVVALKQFELQSYFGESKKNVRMHNDIKKRKERLHKYMRIVKHTRKIETQKLCSVDNAGKWWKRMELKIALCLCTQMVWEKRPMVHLTYKYTVQLKTSVFYLNPEPITQIISALTAWITV